MRRPSHPKRRFFCPTREIKKIGFIMIAFGLITFCAFFLPIQAWIIMLGLVLIYCGVQLSRWFR